MFLVMSISQSFNKLQMGFLVGNIKDAVNMHIIGRVCI